MELIRWLAEQERDCPNAYAVYSERVGDVHVLPKSGCPPCPDCGGAGRVARIERLREKCEGREVGRASETRLVGDSESVLFGKAHSHRCCDHRYWLPVGDERIAAFECLRWLFQRGDIKFVLDDPPLRGDVLLEQAILEATKATICTKSETARWV